MTTHYLTFDFPLGWQLGLPLVVAALVVTALAHRRRGMAKGRIALLTALRAIPLLALVFLIARPTWVSREPPTPTSRTVALLVDRSESMSVEEGDKTRYEQALEFARDHLLPAMKDANIPVQAVAFAEDAEPADGNKLNTAKPTGRRTNLGGAIAKSISATPNPPLAVVALTDGIANEHADNARGLSALVENRVPFIGLGFGGDVGARTLSLRHVDAPNVVSTNALFRVSAELEMMSADELPPFDLVLMRDGKAAQKKTVQPGKGARLWLESFQVSEAEEGTHQYVLQFLPPAASGLKCANTMASASVLVASERELRVLYVQGALTWDYKFVNLAIKGDPSIKLTGLTRTSKQSVFRQNVETEGELKYGFPTKLDDIAPFRVVVLASLTPTDLSPPQQELLAHFCGELGGGLLMIGGPATFNSAWQGSRLEQLLPVTFAANPGVQGLDRPFRFRLTDEALQHPLFAVANDRAPREVWADMATFTQYGRVDASKRGAQIWAEHPDDEGPRGKRVLMASQRFGAGLSAVICVQNLWRWRLAREADPQQFDRFWRQLFRFLSEPSKQEVTIHLADQELHPQMDVQLSLEKRPQATDIPGAKQKFFVRVEAEKNLLVTEQSLELLPGQPADMSFRAEKAGLYTVKVQDAQKRPAATRTIEIRDTNLEFLETARNMETLRQWASLSEGLAFKVEDCPGANELIAQIKTKVEQARRFRPTRTPAGVNVWTLVTVLGCLGAEWMLRKRWARA
ncbi:MAG: VWA domain-containing protein [Verrucomicrobia bacterium]|nr:VWA domain-containing protein [Verrucomicrobiota bacterium]